MLIEAIGNPLTYKWPGGEVRLEPGRPVDLPDARAKRLLDKAPGKVRVFNPTIGPGSLVIWRSTGEEREGFVDFLHTDDRGNRWAFVGVIGGTWAAVNLKFLNGSHL